MGSDSHTHTAGPWVHYEGSSSIWSADGTAVCILCGPRDGTRERQNSNAPLIVAAPCMKEALEDLLDEIISHMRAEGWSSYEIEQRPYIIKARAILSKAGGQTK